MFLADSRSIFRTPGFCAKMQKATSLSMENWNGEDSFEASKIVVDDTGAYTRHFIATPDGFVVEAASSTEAGDTYIAAAGTFEKKRVVKNFLRVINPRLNNLVKAREYHV